MAPQRLGRPFASSVAVTKRMQNTLRRDTPEEIALRLLLYRRGLRYRIDRQPIPTMRSRADLVLRTAKVAVFVNGCFWHGCPRHATWPKANAAWWRKKILANQDRDRRTDAALRKEGWLAIRVWAHEAPERAAARIERLVRKRAARHTEMRNTKR